MGSYREQNDGLTEGERLAVVRAWYEEQSEKDKHTLMDAALRIQDHVRDHNCPMSLNGALMVLYKIGRKMRV